jgi:hypothetical protein
MRRSSSLTGPSSRLALGEHRVNAIARVIPFAAVALAIIVFAFDQTFASQVATMEGIGPVKIGMTAEQAEQALGAKLAPISTTFGKECWVTSRSDKKDRVIQ